MAYETFKHGPRQGQPKTLTDRVIRYLVEGCRMKEAVGSSSSRYRKFVGQDGFYFVGSAGAVRKGRNASNSISVTDLYHARMKQWEKEQLQTRLEGFN